MLKAFELHVRQSGLFSKKDKLLLAISGGLDSVVLAHLLHNSGFTFSLAHCNFNLRDKDSLADEAFCKQLARNFGVKIYTQSFDTVAFLKEHKTNVQLAARKLRYDWFEELLKQKKIEYLVTAHHANDSIETMLLNLLRGTGINGIKGIPEINGNVRRPLLPFSKEDLLNYAKTQKITYREDQSNTEDAYDRNFIRHHIIPKLKELNSNLEQTFLNNANHFAEEAGIVISYLESRASELLVQTHDSLFINKKKLIAEPYRKSLINYLLSGYGFNATQQANILQHLKSNRPVGKLFHSATHRLTIDRNDLVIKLNSSQKAANQKIQSLSDLHQLGLFKLEELTNFVLPASNEVIVDTRKLIFPLSYRPVKTGDKFRPFGMKGFKLLSDFMKEQKLNLFQKENCRLLVNGNGDIIWVVGYRSDERYKVEPNSKTLLKIKALDY